jgi:hypothetical protein
MALLFVNGSFLQQVDAIAFLLALIVAIAFYYQYKKYTYQMHYQQIIDQLFEE